jgi:hypothetical protein
LGEWESERAVPGAAGTVEDRLMEQMVAFSTHIRGNTLELVLTVIPERVVEVTEEGRLGASDHVLIQAKITLNAGPPTDTRGLPDRLRADWEWMRREMAREDWAERIGGLSTE